ncbi:flagellar motor switch protein FliN [Fluviicoccus keumensis]|uniref:Flagellar motor switch protein FliN n=1 Tax=Fluviicoccus keumensis TaxID=1435465 RepID=A0A4Q7YNC8_9GAMM|nr:FliM/FliN family flagellar motor switch protein [Fluviicoccus keumensis]RZU38494.1 flagellar motor switch protein FliN [Fluviicoccus keumensis]
MRPFILLGASRRVALEARLAEALEQWSELWCLKSQDGQRASPTVCKMTEGAADPVWLSEHGLSWLGVSGPTGGAWVREPEKGAWRNIVFGTWADTLPDDEVADDLLRAAGSDLIKRVASAAEITGAEEPSSKAPQPGRQGTGSGRQILECDGGAFRWRFVLDLPPVKPSSGRGRLEHRRDCLSQAAVDVTIQLPVAILPLMEVRQLEKGDVIRGLASLEALFQVCSDNGEILALGRLGKRGDSKALILTGSAKQNMSEAVTLNQVVEQIGLGEVSPAPAGRPLLEKDLKLVGHVAVELVAEIGTASLSLDELFALKNGDVVTLRQRVEDPVILRLNGKQVAKGQLVAVEDNFGIQITEIL